MFNQFEAIILLFIGAVFGALTAYFVLIYPDYEYAVYAGSCLIGVVAFYIVSKKKIDIVVVFDSETTTVTAKDNSVIGIKINGKGFSLRKTGEETINFADRQKS